MFERRKTKQIYIGTVGIGSEYPVSVQSMTNTDTRDVKSTVNQIKTLQDAGCDMVRLAIVDKEAAEAIKDIKKSVTIPLIADIHFDYKLAIQSINNGIDALRLNPGNIGDIENVKEVAKLALKNRIPIRIGVNSGSIEREYRELPVVDAMISSVMKHIKLLEDSGFDLIKISLKSSSVPVTINAYKRLALMVDYPFHLGITEAGTLRYGTIKSAAGIGSLLSCGIGDTIRVSLTDDPVKEVIVANDILKSLELKRQGLNLISCPTCGRCEINLIELAGKVEEALKNIEKPLTVAVMGCVVNGPGEAAHADIGIAGGRGTGVIFKGGKILKTVPQDMLFDVLMEEIRDMM